jgi:hypothetical protein
MKHTQNGNVLFLILIAVALFAALSYAVTTSTRGGGNADKEIEGTDIATYSQKVAFIRSSIQRMMIIQGLTIDEVKLCDVNVFCRTIPSIPAFALCTSGENCLFAPEGGGVDPLIMRDNNGVYAEVARGATIDGHGTKNILLTGLIGYEPMELSTCQEIQKSFGLPQTIEREQNVDLVYADGLPSLQGQWDFCYDRGSTPTVYVINHLLATN